jgi:peptidyl-prolyl cis-trans isomerase D
MLNALRKYATGWVAQLFIGILVLSFAVWGVSDIFTGFRSDAVAQVGSTDVTVYEFQREYDLAIRTVSQQVGTPITQPQAAQMGIPGQVLGRLIGQATLDEAAADLGLGISDEGLSQQIATDPQFFGPDGTFNRGYLSQYIRTIGLTEDQFIVNRRRDYTRGQLGHAFAGGIAAPEAYLRAVHEFRNETRDVSYVVLTAPSEDEIADADETTLVAWFAERKADRSAPEYRAARYFIVSPDQIARVEDVTDADARARYDANPQRFATVERRRIEQIVFPDRAEADAASSAIAGGQSFDDIMASRSLTPQDVDLGTVTRAQLADPAIADAAFALAAGAVSPVVDGRFGPVILRVGQIEPAVVTPYETVVETLKTEIAAERAVAEVNDMYDAIEDARAGGDTIADVSAKYGIPLVTIASVDESGKDEAGNTIADLPAKLVAGIFESDVGLENDPIERDRTSFVWYEVTAVTQPRERPLAEVRDRVLAAWKEEQRKAQLERNAAAMVREVNDRGSLVAVAAELFMAVRGTPGVKRVTTPSGDLSSAAVAAIFDAETGKAVSAAGSQPMTALVLVVDTVSVPPFDANAPELAQSKEQFDAQFVSDILGMYIGELQSKVDVRFNQPLLEQVLGVRPN